MIHCLENVTEQNVIEGKAHHDHSSVLPDMANYRNTDCRFYSCAMPKSPHDQTKSKSLGIELSFIFKYLRFYHYHLDPYQNEPLFNPRLVDLAEKEIINVSVETICCEVNTTAFCVIYSVSV